MNTHHELSILARARMAEIERELERRSALQTAPTGRPGWISRMLAGAAHNLSIQLLALGRRLRCYELRLLRQI